MAVSELRRLRKNQSLRDKVSEVNLLASDIILPYFVVEGKNIKKPISSMPGVYHLSIDNLLKDIASIKNLSSVLLFGLATSKDERASQSYQGDAVLQKAIRAVKKEFKQLVVISDACLCGYTSHGHCAIVREKKPDNRQQGLDFIDNEATLKVLSKIAISHAEAGADFVAPSAMMDGQVKAIREALTNNSFSDVGILAYSAKYASNFYWPFREALDSVPQFGDRKNYQMDFRNSDEALREIEQDISEGADVVMVKPALAYLDIIYRAKQNFVVPVAAYNVSGEYVMIKNMGKEAESLAFEVITSIKRAGADFIITYWAKEVMKWLK